MSPMPRSRRNLGLPDNVRVREGYYSFRHPITKKEWGLGRDNTQELLGHKDPRMTRVYHDPRGAEFIDVAVR